MMLEVHRRHCVALTTSSEHPAEMLIRNNSREARLPQIVTRTQIVLYQLLPPCRKTHTLINFPQALHSVTISTQPLQIAQDILTPQR